MASIIHSFRRIFEGEIAFETHAFFVVVAMLIAAAVLIIGLQNPILFYVLFLIGSFIAGGYALKFMHNNINSVEEPFPDIDLDIPLTALKAIPVYIVAYLIGLLISIVLMFIPIIGPIIGAILSSIIMMSMLLLYCDHFKYGEALNFGKVKDLIPKLVVPYLLIILKAILVQLLCMLIIGLLAWTLQSNMFVFITAVIYLFIVVSLAFNHNFATIYNEVTYGDIYESPFYTEQ